MKNIRKANIGDLARIAEIVIFNYRLNFYPIFKDDDYYFNELQVPTIMKQYESFIDNMWVYDDGAVKGIILVENQEIRNIILINKSSTSFKKKEVDFFIFKTFFQNRVYKTPFFVLIYEGIF